METVLFIDGENVKGKIKDVFKELRKDNPVWHEYNFKSLFDRVLDGIKIDRKVFYFAKIKEHEQSREKSRQLIEEQRLLKTQLEKQGFEVILRGRVRGQIENIGDKEIILCSSDSDLQPAIEEVSKRNVNCIYVGFEVNPNKGLSYTTKRTILIRNTEVMEFEKTQKKLI